MRIARILSQIASAPLDLIKVKYPLAAVRFVESECVINAAGEIVAFLYDMQSVNVALNFIIHPPRRQWN